MLKYKENDKKSNRMKFYSFTTIHKMLRLRDGTKPDYISPTSSVRNTKFGSGILSSGDTYPRTDHQRFLKV